MTELNNLAISELPQVLRKETLMEGYWSLIEDAEANCAKLHDAGIRHSVDLFEAASDSEGVAAIAKEIQVPRDYILRLNGLLSHNRFRPVSLKKLEDVDPSHIDTLWRTRASSIPITVRGVHRKNGYSQGGPYTQGSGFGRVLGQAIPGDRGVASS